MNNATGCAVPDCDRPRRKLEWCDMHYWRVKNWGNPDCAGTTTGRATPDRRPPMERIDKNGPGGCWLWTGRLTEKGYGRLAIQGKSWAAHRYVYEQLVGPIDPALQIDHLCRVRRCVNPDHLEPVTLKENLARSGNFAAIALRFNTCMRGHPLIGDNVYRAPSRPNTRRCRECMRIHAQKSKSATSREREVA